MIKNILWAEDFAANDSDPENVKKSRINAYFGEKYENRVECIDKVYYKDDYEEIDLLKHIDENITKIDCVVLDVNFQNGIDIDDVDTEEWKVLKDKFEKGGVVLKTKAPDNNDIDTDYVKKNCGYYIYLYLIHKGFPHDRIFMLTAYKDSPENNTVERSYQSSNAKPDLDIKSWENAFLAAGFTKPDVLSKNYNEQVRDKISKLFSGENEYFIIRNIVFNAIDELKNMGDLGYKLKAFNDHMIEEKEMTKDKLINILDNISRLFDRNGASHSGDVYKSALKLIAEPYEANYKKDNKVGEKIRIYHKLMRLLRNWLFHDKFKEKSVLKQNEFLILFLIAIRSYIGIDGNITDYENIAFNFIGEYTEIAIDPFMRSYDLLDEILKTENTIPLDYFDYITKKGRDDKPLCEYSDLFKGLWIWQYGFEQLFYPSAPIDDLEFSQDNPLTLTHKSEKKYVKKEKPSEPSEFHNKLMNAIEKIIFESHSSENTPKIEVLV